MLGAVTSRIRELRTSGEALIREILAQVDLELDGPKPIDPQIKDERFFQRLLAEGSLGLGESYMDGWWDVEELDGFFDRLLRARLEHKHPLLTAGRIAQVATAKLLNMQDRRRCKRVVVDHYDLDNELYEKMLDRRMQYTCAYWPKAKNLDEAQEHKLQQICDKLDLEKGDRVLDLGCGFGGLAMYAAEKYGCEVTGYNISKEQLTWARAHQGDLPVTFIEKDYRDAQGVFDKVVSVGLCEHVGYKNHRALIEVAHRCVKDDGLFLLHCIGGNRTVVATDPWLEKYIFPGSVIPSPAQVTQAVEELFVIEDWHNFGVSYDRTCVAWFDNFDRNWDSIRSAKYDDRFYRMWKYYLLMCAGSFRARKNQNWELVLSKKGVRGGYRRS